MAEPPSSPPGEAATVEDTLSWYKSQYEQLESELAEFRESSRELEQDLEKDIERAEKQERVLQERAETLGFECEEWKVCASSASNTCHTRRPNGFCRENTRNPRQRQARHRMHLRRRSRRCESLAELSSTSSATSK